jgi:hypothetical protein
MKFRPAFLSLLAAGTLALALPAQAQNGGQQQGGGITGGIKKFFHIGNEGGQPIYVRPVVPDGAVTPNGIDPSLLRPYLFGAYKGGANGGGGGDAFSDALAQLDQINRYASDRAQATRDAFAHQIMAQDMAGVAARNAQSMQLMAQQAAMNPNPAPSGYNAAPAPTGRAAGSAPAPAYRKNQPIIMPH